MWDGKGEVGEHENWREGELGLKWKIKNKNFNKIDEKETEKLSFISY